MVLEMTEFRWTIVDVLNQPEQELQAVMYLKTIGEKMRTQNRNTGEAPSSPAETI